MKISDKNMIFSLFFLQILLSRSDLIWNDNRYPGLKGQKGERGFKGNTGVPGDSRDGKPG